MTTDTEDEHILTAKEHADLEAKRCGEIVKAIASEFTGIMVTDEGWAWRTTVPQKGHCDIRKDLMWVYSSVGSVPLFESGYCWPEEENVIRFKIKRLLQRIVDSEGPPVSVRK